MIDFKGYEPGTKPSEISGQPRLYYDRSRPINIKVPFYNQFQDSINIQKPLAYIIPQGWWKVLELLKINGVQMRLLPVDTTLEVEAYRIEKYNASPRPFEGHHVNSGVQVSKSMKKIRFRKGDIVVPMN